MSTQTPDTAAVLNQRAIRHYDRKEYAEATKLFEQALAIEPDNEMATRGRIASLRLSQRYDDAQRAIDEALNKFPNNTPILTEQGWLFFDRKRYNEAINAF